MTWVIPRVVEPSTSTVVSSIWPGVGSGVSAADTLVQAGTEQDGACELGCAFHLTSYYFWLETFPQESQLEITNLAAHPGDLVSALVEYDPDGAQAYFQLIDQTTKKAVYTFQDLTGSDASSGSQDEWIVERTEACGVSCNFPSLNNFGTEQLSSVQAAVGWDWSSVVTYPYLSALGADPITMYNCAFTTQLAQTSTVSRAGDFSVTWKNYGKTEHC